MKNKVYVGCDPGLMGAIAFIYKYDMRVFPMPILDGDIDLIAIKSMCDYWSFGNEKIVAIEKVWKPNSLVRSTAMIETLFRMDNKAQVIRVAPATWRKHVLKNYLATKQDAIDYVTKTYAYLNLYRTEKSKKKDHNLAEAVCVAIYAKLHTQG